MRSSRRRRLVGLVARDECRRQLAQPVQIDPSRPGDVIEGEWVEAQVKAPQSTTPTITLDELLQQHSPEEIMAANNNQIPGTAEDVRRVAEVLNADNS